MGVHEPSGRAARRGRGLGAVARRGLKDGQCQAHGAIVGRRTRVARRKRGSLARRGLYDPRMEMSPARWGRTCAYLRDVFGRQDAHLAGLMGRAVEGGLPDIAVSADVGRLIGLLTSMTGGGAGARLAIEVGTLAGYSGVWIARGLAPGGRLITIEYDPKHAAFARRTFDEAGVADRVEVRTGAALDVLPELARELGPESVDVALLDAVKTEYPAYFRTLRGMIRPGGLLLADNALGGGEWWIDDAPGANASRDAVDRFNRAVAADPHFETACVPIREGLLIARRRPAGR